MDEATIATIKKRSISGILALSSRTLILQLISFVAFLIIASFLSAKDIGIYTAVIAVQRIISFFTDFGLGASLIQKKDEINENDIKTTFTLQAGITFCIIIGVLVLLEPIRLFLNFSQEAGRLLLVLVFTIFLSSFKVIPSIMLERSIKFERLVIPQLAESIVFNLLLILLVLNDFKLDSFSIAFLASGAIGIPLYYFAFPWKIRFGLSSQSLKNLRFGIQFQAKNVLATIKDDAITVFLTKVLTFTQIGYIGFAQRLSFLTYRYIVDSVTKVTFSTYARVQENPHVLGRAIEKSLFLVSIPMFPIVFGTIFISPYIIEFFPKWNDKWEPAIVSIVFFSLNALVSSFSGVLVTVLDATGKVNLTLRLMIVWTTLIWILTPLGIVFFGYNGVSIASFLVTLTLVVTVILVKRIVKFEFLKSIYKPGAATLVMAGVVYSLSQLFIVDLLTAIFVILIGGAVYALALFAVAKNEVIHELMFVFSKHE